MARHYNLVIVLFLKIAILISSSSTHPSDGLSLISLDDRLQQLAQDFASYKVNMREILAAKDAQLEAQTENYAKIIEVLATKDARLAELELKVERQQEKIVALEQQIDERRRADSKEDKIPDLTHPVAAATMPKSCADLRYMGHSANGLYLIMGAEMVETVFCDFSVLPSDPSFQTWIGQVDVKSQPVYFYVQRESNVFGILNTSIPFDLARLNIGNAMDLESGKFTAPRDGTYHFAFSGSAFIPESSYRGYLDIGIYLNGDLIGRKIADKVSNLGQWISISLHSTLNLKMGDQVWLQIFVMSSGTYLYDDENHLTHFSGWLLDENISQSLF